MDIELATAIYAATLSTALLIYEILKQRKKLSIILEYLYGYDKVQVIITNTGHRPVTLTGMNVKISFKEIDAMIWENFRRDNLSSEVQEKHIFPVLIKDGESTIIPLRSAVEEDLAKTRFQARINIYDSEGKEHTINISRFYEAKYFGSHKI